MHFNFTQNGFSKKGLFFLFLCLVLFITVSGVKAQQIVNGNLTTGATSSDGTAAPTGYTWSEVQGTNTNAGFGANIAANLTLADDFTIPTGTFTLTKITVFGYSTGYTGSTSPFNDLRFQIFNTDPSTGTPTPVFGDLTTNRFSSSTSASLYRIFNGTPGTTRQVWKIEATVNIPLSGGNYWLEWQTGVTAGLTSNFTPSSTVVGATTQPGYNAKQHDLAAGTWTDVTDAGSTDPMDFHFILNYASGPCTGTPALGNTVSSLSTVCPNVAFDLSVTGTVDGTGVSYQWQSSPDGVSFSNIASANGTTFNASQTATTYYRLASTCSASGLTGFSTPVMVSMNAPTACYCTPPSTDCSLDDVILNVTVGSINNGSSCSTNGYENYASTVAPTDITAGAIVPMSVEVGPGGTEYVGVWIDYDQNGSFDDAEFTALGSGNGIVINGNINVPITATSGQTGMRVRVRYNAALTGADACLGYTYGETEDYLVNIVAPPSCSGTPAPGNTIASVANICSGIDFNLSISNNINSLGMTYQWQSSTDGITFTDIAGANSAALTLNQTATTWYQLVATCSGVSANSTPVQVLINPPSACYCTPPSTNCNSQDLITNVNFVTIDNTTTCSTAGYGDYTTSVAPPILTTGVTYPMSVTVGAGGTERVGVWIDYDQSGTFDANEFKRLGSGNGITITNNIVVPQNAVLGTTRMRVRVRFNTQLTGADACLGYTFGETEDYLVNIIAPPTCSGAPDPGNTVSSVAGACAGVDFTLSTSNNINLTGLTYQWQSSVDGVSFTDISGATGPTYTVQQTANTYYQIITTCSGVSVNSTPLQVTMAPLTECHCIPPPTNCNSNDQITNVSFVSINNTTACSTDGYGNYAATVAPATVMVGERYPLSVTVSSGGTERVYVWIDYDQNGVYDASEFVSVGSGNGVTVSTDITIPRTALTGNTKMRIRLRWNTALTAADACLGYTFGETEDYAITITAPPACSGTPDPGNTLSTNPSICPAVDFELSVSNNVNFSGMTYQWQSSADGTNYTDISGATEMRYTANQTAATWYRMVATCSGVSATSTPLQVTMTALIDCHCTPPSTNCNLDDVITNVVIGTLSNTSACSANGYENYSTSVAPVQLALDSTYDMTVTVGPGGTEYVGVWIDYNQNGVYEDAEFTALGSGNGIDILGTVHIPTDALLGFTKMRVRVRYNIALTGADACTGYTYGETEDYKVEIICRNPDITADPIAATSQCGQTASFTVSATGSGAIYQWQVRASGATNFVNVTNNASYSGANTNTLNITRVADAMNGNEYRAYATSCGVSDTSAAAALTVTRIPGAVTPTSAAFCVGGSAHLMIAGDAPSQSTTVNFSSGALGTAIPDDATLAGINHTINVTGLPANAVVNKVKVKINATHTWVGDLVMVLKAPNGKMLNLAYQLTGTGGAAGTTGLTNTVFASDGTVQFVNGTNPYTGTFKADAYLPATELPNDAANNPSYPLPNVASGPTGFTPDVTSFNDLYSVGNGGWTLALYDYWADGAIPGQPINTLDDWSLEITYSTTQISVGTWSPATGLFTNAGLTSAYTAGDLAHDVYTAPTSSTDYTLVVQSTGCSSDPITIPVTVYTTPTAVISAAPYTSLFPGLQTTMSAVVSNASTPDVQYQWQLNNANIMGGTNATHIVDVNGIGTYSLVVTDGHGCVGASSNTVTITDSLNNRVVFAYPNPSQGMVDVRYYDKLRGQKSPMYVVLYDNKGARVYSKPFNVTEPFGKMQLDLTRFAKGIYQLDLVDGSGERLQTTKIVLQ